MLNGLSYTFMSNQLMVRDVYHTLVQCTPKQAKAELNEILWPKY